MLLAAVASVVVLISSNQVASDPPEGQVAPLTCANTLTGMLLRDPELAKAPAVPEGGSYQISFETRMTVKFDNEPRPRVYQLVCRADLTTGRIISAKVDGIEYVTTPILFLPPDILSPER